MKKKDGTSNHWWKKQLGNLAKREGWEFGLTTLKQAEKLLGIKIEEDDETPYVRGDKFLWLLDPKNDKIIFILVKRTKFKDKQVLNTMLLKMLLTMKEYQVYELQDGKETDEEEVRT